MKRPMTVNEAGKKGGERTKARYGREYYQAIGKKGGKVVKSLISSPREQILEERRKGG